MARKSRDFIENGVQPEKRVWLIAIYIRLSREDARSYDESQSVTNQRDIIKKHISDLKDGDEYVIAGEYVDDGISGTTDDERGGFQDMLRDIKSGKINCVIVKDLARSFRNYSDQGYYLDDWFPRYNVRFISLFHQPLDSFKEPRGIRSIAVPLQGVMNENHCAETSDKVREVFNMKRQRGEHIGSFAPFGYLKHPQNKNALIIDEEASSVVRDIFSMFLDGMSKNAIVHRLNESGILCPSAYKRETQGLKYANPSLGLEKRPLWSVASVRDILKNRIYCGDMVQGRFRIKSYKVHIQERVPKEQWYIAPSTHEPIIEREVFEKVQSLLKRDTKAGSKRKDVYLFSGFLRCADCGKAMTRSVVKDNVYYFCRTYKDQSKTACTKHSVRHEMMERAVLYAIRKQIYMAVRYEDVMEKLDKAPLMKSEAHRLMETLAGKQRELLKIGRYRQAAWQDFKDGEISRTDYLQMREDYERQEEELEEITRKIKKEIAELKNEAAAESPLLAAFREYHNIDRLTRDVLIRLLDNIKVHENGNISIRFNFCDEWRKVIYSLLTL